jgi:cutinase
LPEDLKRKVAGVVLFGYTKNAQTKSSIPNYPKEKVKVFCSSGDGVCGGTLAVTGGHFSYMGDGSGPKAVDFLLSAIKGERVSGDSGSSEATGGAKGGKGFGGKGFGGKGMGGKGKGSKGSSPTETSNIPATSEASDSTPNKGAPNATPDIESSE